MSAWGSPGSPTAPTIRPAGSTDVEAVRAIVRDAYALYVPRIGREPAPVTADYAELVARGEVWVALGDGQICGVLVLRARPGALLLENVAVPPPLQGRGIGRALIQFAERQAVALGLPAVTLYTNAHMTENLRLYPALGYEEVERRTEDGFDRVYFRKNLDGRPPAE